VKVLWRRSATILKEVLVAARLVRPVSQHHLARQQTVRGKCDLDVVGHYSGLDIFQLHVDERPKKIVTTYCRDVNDEQDFSYAAARWAGSGTAE